LANFDLDKAISTIPPHNTKMRRVHSVPLSRKVLDTIAGIETGAASKLIHVSVASLSPPPDVRT
jgi:hypothetical protein